MMRGFYGDTYAALRDIHTALWIDPDYVIGYYRLAQCLFKLHYHTEAYECLQELKTRFPSYVDHIDVKNLELRITDIMRVGYSVLRWINTTQPFLCFRRNPTSIACQPSRIFH